MKVHLAGRPSTVEALEEPEEGWKDSMVGRRLGSVVAVSESKGVQKHPLSASQVLSPARLLEQAESQSSAQEPNSSPDPTLQT